MKLDVSSFRNYIRTHKWLLVRLLCGVLCCVGCMVLMSTCGGEEYHYIVLCFFFGFSLLFAAGLIKSRILNAVFFWLMPFVNFLLLECFINAPFENTHLYTIGFNLFLYYLGFMLVRYITKNKGLTVIIAAVLAYLIGFANYVVFAFRQNPIMPWDLLSVGTALKVVHNYTLPISPDFVLLTAGLVTVVFFGVSLFGRKEKLGVTKRIIASCVLTGCLVAGCFFCQSSLITTIIPIEESLCFPVRYYQNNGYIVGFMRALQYLKVEKPADYSSDAARALLDQHASPDGEAPTEYPNIIVVMNEAYSDLSVLGEFTCNVDYNPFISSLNENTVKGDLHVSVKGGNTANSEFEFLTGHSMAFLPTGSVPYELYIKDPLPSLASYLKEEFAYTTYAIHPYYSSAWHRETIYPLLGFDKLYFHDAFDKDTLKIRGFMSDAATYDKIIELYENKADGERFFSFCVTLQNHGSYEIVHDSFPSTIFIDGLENDASISQYLTLIKESDAAFKNLIDYFSGVDEPTIILMFGDHQPTDAAIQGLLDKVKLDPSSLVDFEKQYTTEFVLWANYDIEEEVIEYTSCNYLSTLLLERAGLPLTAYQQYLQDLQVQYPVITANCMIDQAGAYIPISQYADYEDLVGYSKLQYYQLFD